MTKPPCDPSVINTVLGTPLHWAPPPSSQALELPQAVSVSRNDWNLQEDSLGPCRCLGRLILPGGISGKMEWVWWGGGCCLPALRSLFGSALPISPGISPNTAPSIKSTLLGTCAPPGSQGKSPASWHPLQSLPPSCPRLKTFLCPGWPGPQTIGLLSRQARHHLLPPHCAIPCLPKVGPGARGLLTAGG